MGMDIVAIAIGAFYVFAGIVVIRAMALDRFMDQVIAALEQPGQACVPGVKSRMLTIGGYLTLAGGVALVLLSRWALVLFLVNAVWQGIYLLWAARHDHPQDAEDKKGRQQTQNATLLYFAATVFVVWLAVQGRLGSWDTPWWRLALEALAVALAAGASWAMIHKPWVQQSEAPALDAGRPDHADTKAVQGDVQAPVSLRLAPEWGAWPLWDDDTGASLNHFDLGLPHDLATRIEAWDQLFQSTYNPDDPLAGGFKDEAARQAYLSQGRDIAAYLRDFWPGPFRAREEFMSCRSSNHAGQR